MIFELVPRLIVSFFFFFNDTATTEIYTLSLHDALPICEIGARVCPLGVSRDRRHRARLPDDRCQLSRSEEHTSELQSPCNLVCRLLLEKKKKQSKVHQILIQYIYSQYTSSNSVHTISQT